MSAHRIAIVSTLLSGLIALSAQAQTTGSLSILSVGDGGGGTITVVGDCIADPCFQSTAEFTFFAAPSGGGIAAFRAITLADLPSTLATDIELSAVVSAAVSAHTAISSAHHTWPLTDAEIPDSITLAAASVTVHEAALDIDWTQLLSIPADLADGDDDTIFIPNADPGVDHSAYIPGHGDGTNCSAGQWAAGVDASGNAQGCTVDDTGTDSADDLSDNTIGDLLDVDETGAATGEALVSNGAGSWLPSAAPVCLSDGTNCPAAGGSGDVVGPASATNNAISLFDGTTGKLIKDSTLTWDGADLTLPTATQIQIPYGTTADPAIEFPGGSGIFGEASNGRVIVTSNGGSAYFQFQIGSGATRVFGGNVTGSPQLINMAPSATSPNIVVRNNDSTTGIGSSVAGDLRLISNGVSGLDQTSTETTLLVEQVNAAFSQTCASDGTGAAGFLAVTVSGRSNAELTNSDPNGCTASLSETNATRGQVFVATNVSNAGGTIDFADSSGVQETGAGCSLGLHGVAVFRYITDRWLLQSCIPTN